MNNLPSSPINDILEQTCAALDIPRSKAEEAKSRYESVGTWLQRDASELRSYDPKVYPQGSFELGTVIKPMTDADEYDIDIVCALDNTPSVWAQRDLKYHVGKEVKDYAKAQSFNERPEEGKRCWTLNYANQARFHLDVLPAKPDAQGMRAMLESRNYSDVDQTEHAISITDQTHHDYETPFGKWPKSNPKGYANWFREQMKTAYQNRRMVIAEARKADVEDISDYDIKTPLQQAIQLLKRHRDKMFFDNGNGEDKPISIIITTLAAKAYNNENTVEQALRSILNHMQNHIDKSGTTYVIRNPVNPAENFADKWPDHPERRDAFFEWLEKARQDFGQVLDAQDFAAQVAALETLLGQRVVTEAQVRRDYQSGGNLERILESVNPKDIFKVPHAEKPSFPLSTQPGAEVVIKAKIGKGTPTTPLSNNAPPVPKYRDIHFEVDLHRISDYDIIKWQIVNTGVYAALQKGLRGEIGAARTIGTGKRHEEQTLYTGSHWVRCYVMKDRVCIAKSAPFVVNIQ